jgi:NAD(P)-dependent dehydrogenase (short-subunit alcohol dehydrogenase family)
LVEDLDRSIVGVEADVRDYDSLQAGIGEAVDELGRIDIVIANAGVVVQEPGVAGWEISAERWRTLVEVNLTGVWHTLKSTVPTMIDRGRGGSIVIVSSTAGLKGIATVSDYAATKHGLVGLMRSFAQELAPHQIRVNTIHPTGVATPMIENEMIESAMEGRSALARNLANMLPVKALTPDEISEAVLWLVSDAARNVTAVALPIDAGFTQK